MLVPCPEHLHKKPDEVQQVLSSKLLKRLLELEQQERLDQLKQNMQQHGVVKPDGGLADATPDGVAANANSSSSNTEWRDLINAAPWLTQEQQQSNWQQQQQQQQQPTDQQAGEQKGPS
jgi:hypothetical protein